MKRLIVLAALSATAQSLHAQTALPPAPIGQAAPATDHAPDPPTPPADHAADTFYPHDAMAGARAGLRREHGAANYSMLLVDVAELSIGKGADEYRWDGQFWYGGDLNRLYVKSEGAGATNGANDHAEVQVLWSRAVDPYFSLQAGLRYDIRPRPNRAYAVLGAQGVAPYWIDLEAHLFLSDHGELLGRIKVSHDMRLTQRLVLQPRLEAEFSAQKLPFADMGAGLSSAELGLRLRYEIKRELAPYIGISHEAAVGGSVPLLRAAGRDPGKTSLVLGVRAYF